MESYRGFKNCVHYSLQEISRMVQNVLKYFSYIHMYIKYSGWVPWNRQGWITMNLSKPDIQGLMLYNFKIGLAADESASSSNSTLGEDTIYECTAQDLFAHFNTRNHDVEDGPRSARPSGSKVSAWRSWLTTLCNRHHFSLQKHWRYHILPW